MINSENIIKQKTEYIRETVKKAGAKGIVFGNSGGKDSALAGILCKRACGNTLGVMMPCGTKQNFGSDLADAESLAKQFGIGCVTVDLTAAKESVVTALKAAGGITASAEANIAPRLRMTTLYAIAHSRGYLVCGTGNKSESYMGYFTKWGDGAYDFNPLSDLTVTGIYELLRHLGAPSCIIEKAPSAGLFEGQTDEAEMGVTYAEIDAYLAGQSVSEKAKKIIETAHAKSAHKR